MASFGCQSFGQRIVRTQRAATNDALEHFSAKWIRFAVKKCGTPRKRADSMPMETVLGDECFRHRASACGHHHWKRQELAGVPDAGVSLDQATTRIIEANGLLVMPGLINRHLHAPGNLMKGALKGRPLEIVMQFEVPL
ncbi:hypothetical protein ILT44_25130 [Microvirga sp. BT689]|uniref:hypothetical protein n=1 Tax=Microvirga arvi TaxID=2778731 RepID=UPI00194F1F7A|nr:hypothetical protein [Microvirga arvi]MBM6583489.1 hypothetical protein [Microvirga arvi]